MCGIVGVLAHGAFGTKREETIRQEAMSTLAPMYLTTSSGTRKEPRYITGLISVLPLKGMIRITADGTDHGFLPFTIYMAGRILIPFSSMPSGINFRRLTDWL